MESSAKGSSEESELVVHPNDPGGEIDETQYQVYRRAPLREHATKTDIYVASVRNMHSLHKRIKALLFEDNEPRVTLHGLGPSCIISAVELAVQVCERYSPWIVSETTTATEVLTDDYTPLLPGLASFTRQRLVSSIHIVLSKHTAAKPTTSTSTSTSTTTSTTASS